MPIIKDETEGKERVIIFELVLNSSEVLTLPVTSSVNFLISGSEPFSLQKKYRIEYTRFEKRIDSLILSDGTNIVNFSSNLHEEQDQISIEPDFSIPLVKRLWNKTKQFRLEPSLLTVGTRIRTARLQDLGLGANPTLSWNIAYQVYFKIV